MKVYLNKAFLVNFFLTDSRDHLYSVIERYIGHSASGAEIFIDFDFDEAYKDPSLRPIVRQIAQKLPITNASFIQDCRHSEFHNDSQSKLFFIDNEPGTEVVEEFGCFITDSTNLHKGAILFYTEKFRINSEYNDWKVLENIKHVCNALVITDNYLFINDKNNENLFSILESLMPKSLNRNFGFHLTIVGYEISDDCKIENQRHKLQTHLDNKFDYRINVTILRKKYHDRYIFTNYYRIVSPRGFSLFLDKNILNYLETTLDCTPVTDFGNYSSLEKTMKEELEQIKKINKSNFSRDRISGNRINRLLM